MTTLLLVCDISQQSRRRNGILHSEKTNSMELLVFIWFYSLQFLGWWFFPCSCRDVYEFMLLCLSIQSNGPVNSEGCFRSICRSTSFWEFKTICTCFWSWGLIFLFLL